jgi:hypothetical protein
MNKNPRLVRGFFLPVTNACHGATEGHGKKQVTSSALLVMTNS